MSAIAADVFDDEELARQHGFSPMSKDEGDAYQKGYDDGFSDASNALPAILFGFALALSLMAVGAAICYVLMH